MLARTLGAVLAGIDASLVQVEVDLSGGLPAIAAVGLPDTAVKEGLDRIRAAVPHAGFKLPQRRITVNLAPAGVRKQGAGLDLPMALALLAADGQVALARSDTTLFAGELSLDGRLRPVRGTLSIALAARSSGLMRMIVPTANAQEAALVEGLDVYAAETLAQAAAVAAGAPKPKVVADTAIDRTHPPNQAVADLADVRGQATARRALEIAAAGGHHLLLTGPPGAGKSMLARRLPGILPPMTLEEALAVTQVWSAAGLAQGLVTARPFRAPHHGISFAGLTGGGLRLGPGEASLASGGVLYLDELTEFRRDALEALRQPLEDGSITVVRVHGRAVFPAAFSLVASMNPCPCGHLGSPTNRCGCSEPLIRRYLARLSGPLLDRFDLVVDVPPVDLASLSGTPVGEPSASVRIRVVASREIQQRRYSGAGITCNARLGPSELERHAAIEGAARAILLDACARLGLSARGFDRVRRVARTIADLEGASSIEVRHVAEAVQYRGRPALLPA